jgi:hypothetical protein
LPLPCCLAFSAAGGCCCPAAALAAAYTGDTAGKHTLYGWFTVEQCHRHALLPTAHCRTWSDSIAAHRAL